MPITLHLVGRATDALTRARWYYHEIMERKVIWEIAKRCEIDDAFATAILDSAAKSVKTCSEHEKKEWNNAKRLLREHKKKGKSLFGDYSYFIGQFNLYSILSVKIEDNDVI